MATRRVPIQSAYFLEGLQLILTAMSNFELFDKTLSSLVLGAISHGTELAMSHTLTPLALREGLLNYVKMHPNFPAVLAHDRTSCGCLPLLLRAVLGYLMTYTRPGSSLGLKLNEYFQNTVELLLSSGSDPNEPCEGYISPWRAWVSSDMWNTQYNNSVLLVEALEVTKLFLDFGADLSEFDLEDWMTKNFFGPDVSQEVRVKAQELLRHTQGSMAAEPQSLQRKRALSVEERDGKRARTGL